MVANRDLCAFFFEHQGEALHRCKLCGADCNQLPGTGYSNLVSHLASRHEDFRAHYDAHHRGPERPLQEFGFVSEETTHRYHWLRWVVERSMPLCEVDDERTRAMSRWRPTNSKAVKQDMITVGANLGSTIADDMGDKIGVMYDGWSHGVIHFVAVYALYVAGDRLQRTLLALSPLDEGSQDADAHVALFRNVLAVYNKPIDTIQFFVADNCNTNRSIATKLGVPLVGCASHRFNLAVNKFLTEHEPLLQQINQLMQQLRLPNNASDLSKLTPLRAKKRNATRWSSTYEMLQRYIKIRPQLEAVEDLVPSSGDQKKLVVLLTHLEKFETVCKRLQCEATSMNEVRLLFESVVSDYPIMGEYLNPNAKIVHSPAFETGLVKIGAGAKLTAVETAALKGLECEQSGDGTTKAGRKRKERQESYAAPIIQQGDVKRRGEGSGVYSTLATQAPPTSNACERLFSECKVILTPQRSSILPAHFEMLAFLRANKDMWNITNLA